MEGLGPLCFFFFVCVDLPFRLNPLEEGSISGMNRYGGIQRNGALCFKDAGGVDSKHNKKENDFLGRKLDTLYI